MTDKGDVSFDTATGATAVIHHAPVDIHVNHIDGNVNPFTAHVPDDDEEASVGDDDMDNTLPIADEHGNPMHYPDEGKGKSLESGEKKKEASRSVIGAGIESFKYLYSCGLLIFSVAVVMAAIFTKQTGGTADRGIPPVVAFFLFWFLIIWLAMMEGGQGALVGLQPIDKALYAESHPRALKNTTLAHKGDNMERFIVGRQFLVVLVVFLTNMMSSPIKGASVFGMSSGACDVFLANGVAVILTVIMIGQLTAQVNASNCLLDFINNYFMLFTTYVSLGIEFSGLLHSVYLVQIFFSKLTGKPIDSNEPPRNAIQNLFFWAPRLAVPRCSRICLCSYSWSAVCWKDYHVGRHPFGCLCRCLLPAHGLCRNVGGYANCPFRRSEHA